MATNNRVEEDCVTVGDTFTGGISGREMCVECEEFDTSIKVTPNPIRFENSENSQKVNLGVDLLVNKTETKSKSVNTFSKSRSEPSLKFETNEEPNKRRKSVSFADTEGMELTKIFYFKPVSIFSSDEKEIEVFTNFGTNTEVNKQIEYTTNLKTDSRLGTSLRTNMVALETITVEKNAISGRIHVLNLEYHKSVFVRWTQDDWLNTNQSEAIYESSLKSVFVDVFVFKIPVKICKTEFAILYTTEGQEHWDNNNNNNYSVDCYFK